MAYARLAALLLIALGASAPGARAQLAGQVTPGTEGVGLIEQLGEKAPLDLAFTDHAGRAVRIGDYVKEGKPVVLTLVYYDCPMLCNLLLDGFTRTLKNVPGTPGEDYTLLTVSFEPTETTAQAARQRTKHLGELDEAGADWNFLTGTRANILALADGVGFKYRWDARSNQYAHPATLIFLSPDGTITRYLPGLTFNPLDVRLALREASEGKIGSVIDSFLMLCYQYDAATGGYALQAANLMKLGGALTVLVLVLFLRMLWGRDRTAPPVPFSPAPTV